MKETLGMSFENIQLPMSVCITERMHSMYTSACLLGIFFAFLFKIELAHRRRLKRPCRAGQDIGVLPMNRVCLLNCLHSCIV